MASLLHADLPSEDEEDEDYDIDLDNTGEAADRPKTRRKKHGKRRRGTSGAPVEEDGEGQGAQDADMDHDDKDDIAYDITNQPKKAKIDAVWNMLNSRETGGANALAPPSSSTSLAALCGRTQNNQASTDLLWMRQLGIIPPGKKSAKPAVNGDVSASHRAPTTKVPGQQQGTADDGTESNKQGNVAVSETARAAAAAALAAAKEVISLGATRAYNKVTVTETRRFAGKDIQVTMQVDKDSKEAAKAAEKEAKAAGGPAAGPSGLDKFLTELEKKKKVNVLEKSKMDWKSFKSTDNNLEEELEAYKKSNNKYLDKVDFLKKAELREYEQERDRRLGADVRNRGRL